MIRSSIPRRAALGASGLLLAAMVPWFASCADSDENEQPSPDASGTTLGEASIDAGPAADAQANVDSGCNPAEPDCVSHVLSCDEAAWCVVPTTVSSLYALTSLWGSGKNDIWAVGSGGMIAHYDGAAWKITPTTPATLNTFHGVWGSGPDDVWAVSMTDVIYHSTGFANGTATWTLDPGPGAGLPRPRTASTVWGTSAADVRIGFRTRFLSDPVVPVPGNYNQSVKTTDRDGNPTWRFAQGEGYIFGFWGTANDIWYIADNSETNGWQRAMSVHGTAGGKGDFDWTVVETQSTVTLEGIWGSGPNDIWAVGDHGTIRHMTAGGSRWDIVASPTTEALHGIWGSGPNDVWAVGDNGTILHFSGSTWRRSTAAFDIGKKPRLSAVWGSAANDVWIVGDSVSLHYTGPKAGVEEQ